MFIDWFEKEIPTGPIPSGSSNVEIQIDGFAALGSQAGDSCGAAPALPDGLQIVSIEVVHSVTGKSVGFEGFKSTCKVIAKGSFFFENFVVVILFTVFLTLKIKKISRLCLSIKSLFEKRLIESFSLMFPLISIPPIRLGSVWSPT